MSFAIEIRGHAGHATTTEAHAAEVRVLQAARKVLAEIREIEGTDLYEAHVTTSHAGYHDLLKEHVATAEATATPQT